MNELKIQVYSDIHIEFYKDFPKLKPLCDYLFLAGDIGKINTKNFKDFFNYCSANWKKVFYVLGNHEYYHSYKSLNILKDEYQNFFKNYPNIHLLDNDIYELENVIIVGSTLWSNPENIYIKLVLNDFKCIKSNNKSLSIEEFNNLHLESIKFICEQLDKYKNKKMILMTHFPPLRNNTSHPKYNDQPQHLKEYFASDFLKNIPNDHTIVAWLYGHTHYSNTFEYNKIRLISNQLGYKEEYGDSNFNETGLYTINL